MDIESICIEKLEDIKKLSGRIENRHSPLVVELITDGTEPIPLDRFNSLECKTG